MVDLGFHSQVIVKSLYSMGTTLESKSKILFIYVSDEGKKKKRKKKGKSEEI